MVKIEIEIEQDKEGNIDVRTHGYGTELDKEGRKCGRAGEVMVADHIRQAITSAHEKHGNGGEMKVIKDTLFQKGANERPL